MATAAPIKCSCGATKQSFGMKVLVCPDCDFARCRSGSCAKTVRLLAWTRCPHCGTRQ